MLMLFLSSPPFPSHFLLSFSKFIQQISIEHLCAWLARPTLQGPVLGKAAALCQHGGVPLEGSKDSVMPRAGLVTDHRD